MFSAGDAPVSEPPPRPFSPPVAVLGLEAGEDKEGCAGGLRHPKGGARRREGGGGEWGTAMGGRDMERARGKEGRNMGRGGGKGRR